MKIISTREFRSKQKDYFEMATKETVLVTRKNASPMLITTTDEDKLSNEEILSIYQGLEDIKNGKVYTYPKDKGMATLIKNMLKCTK